MTDDQWVRYSASTNSYVTPEGTSVAAELVETVECLADLLWIAKIRADQRAALALARIDALTQGAAAHE